MMYARFEDGPSPGALPWHLSPWLLNSLGLTTFAGCLWFEHLSHMPTTQPTPSQFQTAVNLDEGSRLGLNETQCLPSLHESFLGIELPHRSHYCRHNETLFFEPIAGCLLAPPQPYWFAALLTTVKGIGIFMILYTRIKENYSWFEKRKAAILGWSTLAITVVSVFLLVRTAFNFNVPTLWQHYQCAGIVFADAPWVPNILLLCVSWKTYGLAQENPHISKETKEMMSIKEAALLWGMVGATLAVILFLSFFFVTNIFLACIFFGGCVPLVCGFVMWGGATNHSKLCATGNVEEVERELNFSPLIAIPGAVLSGFAMQWMAASSAYYETSQCGYFEAMALATTERRSDIYLQNVYGSVVSQGAWLSEIINEVLP